MQVQAAVAGLLQLPRSHAAIDPALQATLLPTQALPGPSQLQTGTAGPLHAAREVLQLRGHSPSEKVAGSRRSLKANPKGKGKARMDSSDSRNRKHEPADEVDARGSKKGGRIKGVANYTDEEVLKLLDFAERELPVGGKGWSRVGLCLRAYAKKVSWPERTDKSIEAKFKQVRHMLHSTLYSTN